MKKTQDSRLRIQSDFQTTICSLLLIFIYGLLPAASYGVDVNEIVERIEGKYREINDIKGAFSQRSFLRDLQRTETYSGRFFIKKPSSMKWIYSEPRDEEVIINGNNLWIYKKSQKQVLKGLFEGGRYSQLPIALLQSMDDLKRDFHIEAIKEHDLELTPRHKMGIIKKIQIVTDQGEFPIKMLTIFDIYENVVAIEIKEVDVNPNLSDSIFIFKVPPDVEVFDLGQ